MKVLITGANGFLGQHLCIYLTARHFTIIAANRGERRIPVHNNIKYYEIDLTNKNAVEAMVQHELPDVIIHTAAMSKPDECANNQKACIDINVSSTNYLLNALKEHHPTAHFIYISTDFIFGENGPHSEDDEPAPLNFYGESKLLAEQSVKNSGTTFTIVRPVFIYGPVWEGLRGSFLHWIKSSLEQGKHLKIVSDQKRTPTYVYDICKGIEKIIHNKQEGIYHLAGKDILSPYEMAVITAKVLRLDASLIENVTSETFPEPVIRAKRSGLKIDKAKKELEYDPVNFEEGVRLSFLSF